MTATPAEFGNSLKIAFPGQVEEGAGWFQVSVRDVCLRFDYTLKAPLRIGILALPRMEVSVAVLAGEPEAASLLLQAVDRVTQRGGG